MLEVAGRAAGYDEAVALMESVIADGSALRKFAEFVAAQGGDESYVYEPERLPKAAKEIPITAPKTGYIHRILAEQIGVACMMLGGGRETKESVIDLSVGIVLEKKNGDPVEAGETLATVHVNDETRLSEVISMVTDAYEIFDEPAEKLPVIRQYIR
jgi:pyrimidine-nucleoside phosphorylase